MYASRFFHVIAGKRRPSFPPIWLNMTLGEFVHCYTLCGLARTTLVTSAVVFGRLIAAFAFVAFLAIFFIIASLLWTGAPPYERRERRLVLISWVLR